MDWDKVSAQLSRKLDPAHIRPPAPGKFGEYLDGHHVISEANRIFGYGGWCYTVTRLEKVSEQTVEIRGKPQFRVGYLCAVRLVVDGVVREGTAVGSGVGGPDSIADHHESAIKEAETDALKRALRTFGNPFGLALYDKTRADIGVDPTDEDIAAAVERIGMAETLDELRHVFTGYVQEFRALGLHPSVVAAKDARKNALEAV